MWIFIIRLLDMKVQSDYGIRLLEISRGHNLVSSWCIIDDDDDESLHFNINTRNVHYNVYHR